MSFIALVTHILEMCINNALNDMIKCPKIYYHLWFYILLLVIVRSQRINGILLVKKLELGHLSILGQVTTNATQHAKSDWASSAFKACISSVIFRFHVCRSLVRGHFLKLKWLFVFKSVLRKKKISAHRDTILNILRQIVGK